MALTPAQMNALHERAAAELTGERLLDATITVLEPMISNTEPMRFYVRSSHIGCVAQFRFAEDLRAYLAALSATGNYDLWTVYDRTVSLGSVPRVLGILAPA